MKRHSLVQKQERAAQNSLRATLRGDLHKARYWDREACKIQRLMFRHVCLDGYHGGLYFHRLVFNP